MPPKLSSPRVARRKRRVLLGALLIAQATGIAAANQISPACPISRAQTWTSTEMWVWTQTCHGKKADLNLHFGRPLRPTEQDGWTAERQISASFLESLSLRETFRPLSKKAIIIIGAWLTEPVDLSDSKLDIVLRLEHSRFDESVMLAGLINPRTVALVGSVFRKDLNLNGVRTGSLLLRNIYVEGDVDLVGVHVDGHLELDASRFEGRVDISNAVINGFLGMREGVYEGFVSLSLADISGQATLSGSRFIENLYMDSIRVGNSLLLHGGEARSVLLRGAHVGFRMDMRFTKFEGGSWSSMTIGNALELDGVCVSDLLVMKNTEVGGSLTMEMADIDGRGVIMASMSVGGDIDISGAKFEVSPDFSFSKVASNFNLSGAELPGIDMGGVTVKNELRMISREYGTPIWSPGSVVDLRNTRVGALLDHVDAWPECLSCLNLSGFAFDNSIGLDQTAPKSLLERESRWLVEWLERDAEYTPQSYAQLASVLKDIGEHEKASDVLFAGKERERRLSRGTRWVRLSLWRIFVGFGHRYSYALVWIVVLVGLGVAVLRLSGQHDQHQISLGTFYSLDLLLPIVELRKRHYGIDLTGVARHYFYFHQVMGYVLASVVIAGLGG